MFESAILRDVDIAHYWSDGGPHFRNQQVIWGLLNINDPILAGYTVEINFTEKMHGKGEVDGEFAKYVQEIEKNIPKEVSNSIQ
ncbi:MAG: hypothetical protein EZS28_032406 [Streblomastix strix]|uniref:Uncharacterized protein n=1 Tax=Streblomastix strix TaxID=222440 RepID=A0A5J4UNR1_9EUKA|nr:MAG: hypothetical protein EZS28_032406 [Streblomastix strix]